MAELIWWSIGSIMVAGGVIILLGFLHPADLDRGTDWGLSILDPRSEPTPRPVSGPPVIDRARSHRDHGHGRHRVCPQRRWGAPSYYRTAVAGVL